MVNDKIHERLSKLGSYGDSMSDIIGRLLDEHESYRGQAEKKEVVANWPTPTQNANVIARLGDLNDRTRS